MKRINRLALTALMVAGLSVPVWSQAKKAPAKTGEKPADACAMYKTAPKNESAADKKKRQTDLKKCQDDQKMAKQKSAPAAKKPATKKKGGN
jgi:hypothetical protein